MVKNLQNRIQIASQRNSVVYCALIDTPVVQILPIGGLWAFLFGAIPFILGNRFRVLEYATLIAVISVLVGVLVITVAGDTLRANKRETTDWLKFTLEGAGERTHGYAFTDTTFAGCWI